MSYKYKNSRGVEYHLNCKTIKLRNNGKEQNIYYFSKDFRKNTACDLPEFYEVRENPKNGFLVVAIKDID